MNGEMMTEMWVVMKDLDTRILVIMTGDVHEYGRTYWTLKASRE